MDSGKASERPRLLEVASRLGVSAERRVGTSHPGLRRSDASSGRMWNSRRVRSGQPESAWTQRRVMESSMRAAGAVQWDETMKNGQKSNSTPF